MAITLTINNIPFEYPEPGEQSPWGQGATDWATEVTNVLDSLKGSSDILETSAIVENNVSSPKDITGLAFSSTVVRSFTVTGNIYRISGTTEYVEEFELSGMHTTSGGWVLSQTGMGDAEVLFSITPAGQIQYISSNLTSTPYSGIFKFRGIALLTN